MHVNRNANTYKPPFTVVPLDAMDAYYYADVMDNMKPVGTFDNLNKAKAISDALFVLKNSNWESLQAMNDADGGYDVRIYDEYHSCACAAHEKFKDKWIGS